MSENPPDKDRHVELVRALMQRQIERLSRDRAASDVDDAKATLEAAQLSGGKTVDQLADEAKSLDHNRTQTFKNHFARVSLGAMYGIAAGAAVIAFVWLLHIVLPAHCHWLTEPELDRIQSMLTGGVLATLIAEHFRRNTS